MQRYPITPSGHQQMQDDLIKLKNHERPRIIVAIAEAKEQGDLSENAEYTAAKEEQGMIEARIADLEGKLALAEVIDVADIESDKVQFGATVTLIDIDAEKTKIYKIIGDYESDLTKGHVSIFSPIAQAILGKKVNDEVEVQAPGGTKYYEVKEIKYI
jgi:transcription elongation factor GreA